MPQPGDKAAGEGRAAHFSLGVSTSAILHLTLALLGLLWGLDGAIAEEAVSAALKMRVEQLAAGQEVRVRGELIAARKLLSQFYRQREFRPAWLRPEAKNPTSCPRPWTRPARKFSGNCRTPAQSR